VLRKVFVVGISPHPSLITCRALKLIEEAPAVLVMDTDYPFDLSDLLKGKRVIKLRPTFTARDEEERRRIIEENRRKVLSLDVDWAVWLEIGTPAIRNPIRRHLLGETVESVEVEFVPGVSSVTAVLDRLGTIVKHLCVFGGEEVERIERASEACDVIVIINLHDDRAPELLRSKGFRVRYVEECCTERERVTDRYTGATYWVIAVATREDGEGPRVPQPGVMGSERSSSPSGPEG
jgi:Precorrin-2 methylase